MNYQAVKASRLARGISGAARALALDLAIYADAQGAVKISQERLADDLDVDTRRVRKLVSELVGVGILQVTRGGKSRGDMATYQFAEKAVTGGRVISEKEVTGDRVTKKIRRSPVTDKGGHLWPPEVNNKQDNINTPRACEGEPLPEEEQSPASEETERLWREVLARLKRDVDPESFQTWLASVECRELGAAGVVLVAPTDFFRRWILHNYAESITGAARAVLGTQDEPALAVQVLDDEPGDGGGDECRVIALK